MKKQPKRLSLSRETIHVLESETLSKVDGGIVKPSLGDYCSINVCPSDSCQYTTCY
jgi:hypothetical protein